jgi:hypothetical protein
MTAKFFKEWLTVINAEMKKKKRKILLFLYNATSHANLQLFLIQLKFLPANTTSVLHH